MVTWSWNHSQSCIKVKHWTCLTDAPKTPPINRGLQSCRTDCSESCSRETQDDNSRRESWLVFWPAFEPRSMNFSVLRNICTWLRNEDFQLWRFALVIACKKDARGIGVAKGVRKRSVGNPELQLMLKEKRYRLSFRVLLLKNKPYSKNSKPERN